MKIKFYIPWYKNLYYLLKVFLIGEMDSYLNINGIGSRFFKKGKKGIFGKFGRPTPLKYIYPKPIEIGEIKPVKVIFKDGNFLLKDDQ